MAEIIFNNYTDLKNFGATPSSQGFTVAYDLDGVLKQKDENGVITPISSISSTTLERVLKNNNFSGTYSIVFGTNSTMRSITGKSVVRIENATSSVSIMATESNQNHMVGVSLDGVSLISTVSTKKSALTLSTKTFSAYVGTTTYSTFIENTDTLIKIGHSDTNIGAQGKINVIESGKTYDQVGSVNKAYLHLNTFGASTSYGVENSVVVGGRFLTASRSNYVYLGNWVNVNNAYTLPNTDGPAGYYLTTNGGGTVSWASFSVGAVPLSKVLADGNYSGTNDIVMHTSRDIYLGTNSSIKSTNSKSGISLDNLGDRVNIFTDASLPAASTINMATVSTTVTTRDFSLVAGTGSITTSSLQGLVYATDYSSTFVGNSLITKTYLDNNSGSYLTHLIVYVDPNTGNNSTGAINRPNKPYQTIAAAMIGLTASSYDSSNKGVVYLRKGNYTDVARLVDNVDYFCEQGVVFTQNGFSDASAVNSNVYGNASFIGTNANLVPLTVAFGSTVKFEFDTVDNRQAFARIYGSLSNVSIRGKYVKTQSSAVYGISIEGSSTVDLQVERAILGAYRTVRFADNYTGTTNIRTPYIYCDGTIGVNGYTFPNNVRALYVGDAVTGTIYVNSNVQDISSVFGGSFQSAVYMGSGNVAIRGGVKSLNSIGVYTTGTVAGSLMIDGDVIAKREAISANHVGMNVKIRSSRISSDGLGGNTQSIFIGANNQTYIENSLIYNGLSGSHIIKTTDEDSTIGLYNTLVYSEGVEGNLIECSFLDYTIGMHNVRSNKDNAANITDLFDPSGFFYDPYLFVPKF